MVRDLRPKACMQPDRVSHRAAVVLVDRRVGVPTYKSFNSMA